jgi:hypothetical protein
VNDLERKGQLLLTSWASPDDDDDGFNDETALADVDDDPTRKRGGFGSSIIIEGKEEWDTPEATQVMIKTHFAFTPEEKAQPAKTFGRKPALIMYMTQGEREDAYVVSPAEKARSDRRDVLQQEAEREI